jgi:hypothetical protein
VTAAAALDNSLLPRRASFESTAIQTEKAATARAAVTQYVRNEMRYLNNLAGDDKRRNNVGFALQILQRRLASSPAAIYHSPRRRRERLEARLAEERIIARGGRLQKQSHCLPCSMMKKTVTWTRPVVLNLRRPSSRSRIAPLRPRPSQS